MNKKLFKKVLTAVLTAAILFTSNGIASLNASAAENEKTLVEGVYTNFQKATMAKQTTRQINAYVEPEDATVQNLKFKSSAPEVAKVSATGLITALSSGKATITVTALDGSKQYETIAITVLEDLIITNKYVDTDNEVIILDKTVGNLYIDSSVGDADIYLGGVTVRNILAMDSGNYSLYMYDSTAKELKIDEMSGQIESFTADEEVAKAPKLTLGENTTIKDLNARISASIRQEDGSAIEGLRVTQSEDGKITVYLENYKGGLLLDSSLGELELVTVGCRISNVDVSGDENAGSIQLTDGGDSEIENLSIKGAADVSLGVPTNEVNIDWRANGVSFSSSSSIGTLVNAGIGSDISISGEVDSLEANGEKAKINVAAGGYVGTANLNGAETTLFGAGEVSEAYVNANNINVNTVNTLLSVADVTGTKSQGNDLAAGSTVATKSPAGGGGGGSLTIRLPEPPLQAGDGIIDNDFEDKKYDFNFRHGEVEVMSIVEGGNDSSKALKVSGRNETYHGVGYDFVRYLKKRATVRIKFDIKCAVAPSEGQELKATMKTSGTDSNYHTVASIDSGNANTWYTLEGTFEITNNFNSAQLYIEAPGTNDYFIDNVLFTVDMIGDPIAAESVTLDETEIELNINGTQKLVATILPEKAEEKTVDWTSSDPTIAYVDENGIVKGLKAGSATITAISKCPYAVTKPTATCEVTVRDLVAIDLDRNYVLLSSVGQTKTLSAGDNATWTSSKPEVATVDDNGLVTAVGNGTTTITGTTPTGIGTCTVKVELQAEGAIVIDFDDETVGTEKNMKGSGKATIENDPTVVGSTNKVLKVEHVTYGYSQSPYLEITLPEGKKLGDYVSLLAKIHMADGDVEYKNLRVWAGNTIDDISLAYSATESEIGASENKSKNESFESVTAEFTTMSGNLRNLTGTIVMALGIMADSTAVFYLDEIILVPFTGDPVAINGLVLDKSTLSVEAGKSATLIATINPEGYTTSGEITWRSSDETIATVDAKGKVTAIKEGTATITAKTAVEGVSTTSYEETCAVTVTKAIIVDTTVEVVFQTGYESADTILKGDGGTFTVVTDEKYSGENSMKVETSANWNGVQYTLDNSAGTEAATYTVSAYVRKVNEDDTASVRYVLAADPYTQFKTLSLTTEWQKFECEIPVDAGAQVAFRLAPVDEQPSISYYVDDIKIIKVVAGQPAPVKYFQDFFIDQNVSLGTDEYNRYLNGQNFEGLAQAGGVTDDTLTKFTSWNGIMEVVESIEISVEIAAAQAVTGSSIQLDTLMQNLVDDSWTGSYKPETHDTGYETISELYTINRNIVLSNVDWNDTDTMTGKISVKLKNLKEGTTPNAKITIKVTSKISNN